MPNMTDEDCVRYSEEIKEYCDERYPEFSTEESTRDKYMQAVGMIKALSLIQKVLKEGPPKKANSRWKDCPVTWSLYKAYIAIDSEFQDMIESKEGRY